MASDNDYYKYTSDKKKCLEFYEKKYKNLDNEWWKTEIHKKEFTLWLKTKEWTES